MPTESQPSRVQDTSHCSAEDLALIRRVVRGEGGALELLASRLLCVPRILRACNAKHGNPLREEDIDDLAQDVLLIVWRKIKGFHGLSALEAWVYRICLFEFLSFVRRRSRGGRQLSLQGRGAADDTSGASDDAREPESRITQDPWEFEDVHQGLRRIGSSEAEVIRMKHFEGLTFVEVGGALGISPNTAKARYYRGLDELRPLLDATEYAPR